MKRHDGWHVVQIFVTSASLAFASTTTGGARLFWVFIGVFNALMAIDTSTERER